MIVQDFEAGRFNFRVAAVCMHDGHVLLHRADYENFWSLPGGRAEILEPSSDTVVREMKEELGVAVSVQRLLWVAENFFTYEALRFHELDLFYLVELPEASTYLDTTVVHHGHEPNGVRLTFRWFPLGDLEHVKLVPRFLQASLLQLPIVVEHRILHDAQDIQQGPVLSE